MAQFPVWQPFLVALQRCDTTLLRVSDRILPIARSCEPAIELHIEGTW